MKPLEEYMLFTRSDSEKVNAVNAQGVRSALCSADFDEAYWPEHNQLGASHNGSFLIVSFFSQDRSYYFAFICCGNFLYFALSLPSNYLYNIKYEDSTTLSCRVSIRLGWRTLPQGSLTNLSTSSLTRKRKTLTSSL